MHALLQKKSPPFKNPRSAPVNIIIPKPTHSCSLYCNCVDVTCLYSGGILLTFIGCNLDVSQNPRLVLNGANVSSPNPPPQCVSTCHLSLQSSCKVIDVSTLTCLVPPANANSGQIQYSLILDNAPFPDISDIEFLQLSSSPNPSGFRLVSASVTYYQLERIRIRVRI